MTIVRPVWADPAFCLAQNTVTSTSRLIDVSVSRLIVPNNPTRWAIGFFYPAVMSGEGAHKVVTGSDNLMGGWTLIPAGVWLSLFEHGPTVCGEFYLNGPVDLVLTYVEVCIQTGGS